VGRHERCCIAGCVGLYFFSVWPMDGPMDGGSNGSKCDMMGGWTEAGEDLRGTVTGRAGAFASNIIESRDFFPPNDFLCCAGLLSLSSFLFDYWHCLILEILRCCSIVFGNALDKSAGGKAEGRLGSRKRA